MKPSDRREYLSMRYFLKLRASISNPANKCITNRNEQTLRSSHQKPFICRITDIKNEYDLPPIRIRPNFSYAIHNCSTPRYAIPAPSLNKELSSHPKSITSPIIYKNLFMHLKANKYMHSKEIYCDGSKSSDGVGAAAVYHPYGASCTASLPKEASIFSAELHALQMAVESIRRTPMSAQERKFVIYTDSKSTLDSLNNNNEHPVVRSILVNLSFLKRQGLEIEICWIPSHVGIPGNEKADLKAKEESRRAVEVIPIFFKDYYSTIKSKLIANQHNEGLTNSTMSNIRRINPDFKPWITESGLKRREEVVLNRIRLGHTRITHGHLMENSLLPQTPTICPYCNSALITVEHIFVECPGIENERLLHFSPMRTWRLELMLGVDANTSKIISFL